MKDYYFNPELLQKAKQIKLLALDMDGIMTDGKLIYTEKGDTVKEFFVLDGVGIVQLLSSNIQVVIVSKTPHLSIAYQRANDLGLKYVYTQVKEKLDVMMELCKKLNIEMQNIAFMGDDMADLQALLQVGLSISVPNAYPKVKKQVNYITQNRGGKGAIREVCDLIMQSQAIVPTKNSVI